MFVDTKDYITKAMWQLSNEEYYKKVEKDLTPDHEQLINQLIDEMISNGDLIRGNGHLLKPTDSRTSIFYMCFPRSISPTIPDDRWSLQLIAHGEIVFLCGRISKTAGRKTSITHQRHHRFYHKIEKIWKSSENSILVTLDVSSLCTNRDTDKGLTIVKEELGKNGPIELSFGQDINLPP